jgi:hypothetical protein
MYPEGAWVKLADPDYPNTVGYILGGNPESKFHKIRITVLKGKPVKSDAIITVNRHEDNLYPADVLEASFDTSFLLNHAIDWSLYIKNKNYFIALIQEMGGNKDVDIL